MELCIRVAPFVSSTIALKQKDRTDKTSYCIKPNITLWILWCIEASHRDRYLCRLWTLNWYELILPRVFCSSHHRSHLWWLVTSEESRFEVLQLGYSEGGMYYAHLKPLKTHQDVPWEFVSWDDVETSVPPLVEGRAKQRRPLILYLYIVHLFSGSNTWRCSGFHESSSWNKTIWDQGSLVKKNTPWRVHSWWIAILHFSALFLTKSIINRWLLLIR